MKKTIRIGFVVEQHGNLFRGGAEEQYEKTFEALNEIEGIEVEYVDKNTFDIENFDIIHFFKSYNFSLDLIKYLRKIKKPYVVSTIYLPNRVKATKSMYNFLIRLLPLKIKEQTILGQRYEFWKNAEYLFPNTTFEEKFFNDIGLRKTKVILNGISEKTLNILSEEAFFSQYLYLKNQNYVLNVGRIEQRKNQYFLVKACKELDIPIVLIGKITDYSYYEKIKDLNYSKCYILGQILDKGILNAAYKNCKLFALPSELETPGLSALEALYFNKLLLITENGGTQDYFKDIAYFVNPYDYESIKKGILKLYNSKNENNINSKVLKFKWEVVVKEYISIYYEIMIKNQLRN